MTYKLKHLSKYCCKPETETEFEAVKMAAELGGVDVYLQLNYITIRPIKLAKQKQKKDEEKLGNKNQRPNP